MKKTYVVIIIFLVTVLGFGTYFFGIRNNANVQPQTVSQENSASSTQAKTQTPVNDLRQENINSNAQQQLTNNDLFFANWRVQGSQPKRITSGEPYTAAYELLKKEYPNKHWRSPWGASYILTHNQDLQKTYFAFVERESSKFLFGDTCIYSVGAIVRPHEVVCILNTLESFHHIILSPDRTSIGFITKKVAPGNTMLLSSDEEGTLITKEHFVIIDMSSDFASVIPLPGDPKIFVAQHKEDIHNADAVSNFVAAYRFETDNTIKFVKYYVEETNDNSSGILVSDKELWSYNRNTGELILLEIIPFNR